MVTKRLSEADLRCADLSEADLRCADLSEADLRCADLSEADLRGADLRWADLRGANLRGANLRGADLRRADLRGAKGSLLGLQRSDGYQFFLTEFKDGWKVVAGCRRMTIEEYREHVKSYNDEEKEFETTLILDNLEKRLEHYLEREGK